MKIFIAAIFVIFTSSNLLMAQNFYDPNELFHQSKNTPLSGELKQRKLTNSRMMKLLSSVTTYKQDLFERVNFQQEQYNEPSEFQMTTGIGLTRVDSTNYYLLNLFPSYTTRDQSFSADLDLPLRFKSDGFDFRKEDYKTFTQVLSSLNVTYTQITQSNDFGIQGAFKQVKEHSLGNGSLMYQYNNSTSYEARKSGINLAAAIIGGSANFMLSDITSGGVLGFGLDAEILQLAGGKSGKLDIPVLKHLELGFNFAGDFNENAGILKIDTLTGKVLEDIGSINMINTYLAVRLFDTQEFFIKGYADYSKIFSFGDNFMLGADMNLYTDFGSLVVTFQRRFQGGKYLPTYFDSFYEKDRYSITNKLNGTYALNSKAALLNSMEELKGSTYLQSFLEIGKQLYLLGAYQKIDALDLGGEVYMIAALPNISPDFSIYGGYYKRRIDDVKNLFTFDENAYFFGKLDYYLSEMIVASLSYQQTFAAVRDNNGAIISYEPQKRLQPEINFILPLGR
ncbi:MAG: hypothetical protein OZ913_00555 [Ignavibacteriaceae bacterium]|jgi:hypothetical protein|nr:MAG: hypothetical protein UZ04_CHB001000767 [Chlorobi bacterium OLB4]MBW7855581.1 hypothetical protein [Ignavibacteria bacterium]MEB2328777.1 hypothetical protein [Ignavibacteriaceae bacterium]OQY79063.1 MAG: hypothetical protein B6D43_00255 [Ignavibacteriales bacterium UTCHB1]